MTDAARPGSKVALSHLLAIIRLIEVAEASRPKPPDLTDLSDEDLERVMAEAVEAFVAGGL